MKAGENFFVEAESKEEARKIAEEYFGEPRLIDIMTTEQSEWYPCDVY